MDTEETVDMSFCEKIKKYPLYYLLKFFIILIVIIIVLLIEKLLYFIISLVFYYWFISVQIQIILHLWLLRYLVLKMSFAGLSFIVKRVLSYKKGIREATYLYNELETLRSGLDLIFNKEKPVQELKHLITIQRNIKTAYTVMKCFYKIFTKMKVKFNNLTFDQNIFYENLTKLYNSFEQSEFLKLFNNIIKQLRENKISLIKDLSSIEKEKFNNEKNECEKYVESMNNSLNLIIAQIRDYIGEEYCIFSPRYIRNFFRNYLFASLNQFQVELDDFFIYEEKKLRTKDGNILEYIIIKNNNNGKEENNNNKKLMIICGPNAEPYQVFSRNMLLNKYLSKGIDVLCWNYRGFGFSTGKATFNNIKSDVIEIYEEIEKLNIYKTIGVQGFSLGGVACCYLARQKKDICLLVSDRNFGQIQDIAKDYIFGKYLLLLYKLLFIPSSRNAENYIETNALKIILNDPNDEIVIEESSLKTLLSEEFCKKYLELNYQNIVNSNDINITNSDDNSIELDTLDDSNDSIISNINKKKGKDNLLSDKIISPSINNNEIKNRKNKSALDIILSKEKDNFIKCLINISEALCDKNLNLNKNIICKKFSNKKDQEYSYLKEEELQNSAGLIDFIRNKMILCLKSFKSAGDNLCNLTTKTRRYNQILFIENFFNNLFIWGTYDKRDDYGSVYHSTEYIDIMISKVITILNLFLNSQEIISFKKINIIKDIENFYNYVVKIKNNMRFLGIKSKDGFVLLNNGDNYEKELVKLGRGNYVWLNCGHNGIPCSEENSVFKYYLKQSALFNNEKNKINNNKENDNFGKENIFDYSISDDLDTSISNLTKSIDD